MSQSAQEIAKEILVAHLSSKGGIGVLKDTSEYICTLYKDIFKTVEENYVKK